MEDNNRNAFIDDGGLSKSTSLTHLLNENDNMDSDNIEVIRHIIWMLTFIKVCLS